MTEADVVQYSFVVTAFVTVVGWFIVASQADRREFRKEVRDLIRELRERLDRINVQAAGYWLCVGSDAATAAVSLKANIAALSRQLRTLDNVGIVVPPGLLASIRTAATGGDFEMKGRRRKSADKDRLIDVANAAEDLLAVVDDAFYKMFPPVRRRRKRHFLSLAILLGIAGDTSH